MTDEQLQAIMTKADDDLDRLKDRCHDLYEENERLKEDIDWWKDRFFGQQEYDDSHRITAIEYKERIDKAIQYIDNSDILDRNRNDLLNILNGSDN